MKPQFLLIGLGNIGKQYEQTRHNIGFLALEDAAERSNASVWREIPRFQSMVSEGEIDGVPCLFVKPTTLMNRSGEAIRKLIDFYKLNPATQILVCLDDIDLPLGENRLRMSGGAGTHNGLKSIIDCIGENFPRFRIGLGSQPEGRDLATWILSHLTAGERKQVEPSVKKILQACREVMKAKKA